MTRVFILMMDSFGIGGAPDASDFGDGGAATFEHIAAAHPDLNIPNLISLGLVNAAQDATGQPIRLMPKSSPTMNLPAAFGHMKEMSRDKDTVSGHWEMAGLPNLKGWGHFKPDYPSFPPELIENICQEAGLSGILGNKAASGTVIIQELGEEHIRSGKPICYTSADSCFQIAAHEEHFGLENLYRLCEIAYKHVQPYRIGRVIARPFIGEKQENSPAPPAAATMPPSLSAKPCWIKPKMPDEESLPSALLMTFMPTAALLTQSMPQNFPAYGTPLFKR